MNPAAYDLLAADPGVSDPLTASDAQVAQYADHYYEYDGNARVTKETVRGRGADAHLQRDGQRQRQRLQQLELEDGGDATRRQPAHRVQQLRRRRPCSRSCSRDRSSG